MEGKDPEAILPCLSSEMWRSTIHTASLNCSIIHSGGFRDKPASLSHFSSNGLSLHMFLKLRFKASKREMVVWLKSFPYSFPMARPTSPWWQGKKYKGLFWGKKLSKTNLIVFLYFRFNIHKISQKNHKNKPMCQSYLCDIRTHLREAQFNTPLFEGLGKLFQFFQITGLL